VILEWLSLSWFTGAVDRLYTILNSNTVIHLDWRLSAASPFLGIGTRLKLHVASDFVRRIIMSYTVEWKHQNLTAICLFVCLSLCW